MNSEKIFRVQLVDGKRGMRPIKKDMIVTMHELSLIGEMHYMCYNSKTGYYECRSSHDEGRVFIAGANTNVRDADNYGIHKNSSVIRIRD